MTVLITVTVTAVVIMTVTRALGVQALLGVAIVCNVRETTNVRIPCVDLTTDGPVCTSHSGAMAGMMQNAAPQPVEDDEEDVVGMGAGAARGGVGRGYPEGPGSWV
jgi:hypothetical protein